MPSIRDAIKSFDVNDCMFNECLEAVRTLEALGTAKAEIFIRDIQQSLMAAGEERSNKTVPITSIVDIKKEVRAFSASEAGNIRQGVNNALTSFLSGNKETITKGIGNQLGGVLLRLF